METEVLHIIWMHVRPQRVKIVTFYRVPEVQVSECVVVPIVGGSSSYQTGLVLPHEHLLRDTPKMPIMF